MDEMEEDIDIEEHEVLDNPAIRKVFPDITLIKQEIESYERDLEVEVNIETLSNDDDCFQIKSERTKFEKTEGCYKNWSNNELTSNIRILGAKRTTEKLGFEEFETLMSLSESRIVMHDTRSYLENNERYCTMCSILFPTKKCYADHKNFFHVTYTIHTSEVRNVRRKLFENKTDLDCDVESAKNKCVIKSKVFRCKMCRIIFSDLLALNEHLSNNQECSSNIKNHNAYKQPSSAKADMVKSRQNITHKKISRNSTNAKVSHRGLKLYWCHVCTSYFKILKTCIRHMAHNHNILQPKQNVEKRKFDPQCNFCSESFSSFRGFTCHILQAHRKHFRKKVSNEQTINNFCEENLNSVHDAVLSKDNVSQDCINPSSNSSAKSKASENILNQPLHSTKSSQMINNSSNSVELSACEDQPTVNNSRAIILNQPSNSTKQSQTIHSAPSPLSDEEVAKLQILKHSQQRRTEVFNEPTHYNYIFTCEICLRKFDKPISLINHFYIKHNDLNKKSEKAEKFENKGGKPQYFRYKCNICFEFFCRPVQLLLHLAGTHNITRFSKMPKLVKFEPNTSELSEDYTIRSQNPPILKKSVNIVSNTDKSEKSASNSVEKNKESNADKSVKSTLNFIEKNKESSKDSKNSTLNNTEKTLNEHEMNEKRNGTKSGTSSNSYYRCIICSFYNDSSTIYTEHLKRNHGITKYLQISEMEAFNPVCKYCSRIQPNPRTYNSHLLMYHKEYATEIDPQKHTQYNTEMNVIEIISNQKRKLVEDINPTTNKADRPTTTEQGKSFEPTVFVKNVPEEKIISDIASSSSSVLLSTHQIHTKGRVPILLKSTIFKCNKCDIHFLSFNTACNHEEHMELLVNWKCSTCKRIFKKEDELLHVRQHALWQKLEVYDFYPDSGLQLLHKCRKCAVHFNEKNFMNHYIDCDIQKATSVYCKFCDILVVESISKSHEISHVQGNIKYTDFVIVDADVKAYDNQICKEIPNSLENNKLMLVQSASPLTNSQMTNMESEMSSKLIYRCLYCRITVDTYDKVVEHCQVHYVMEEKRINSVTCKLCNLIFDPKCYENHKKLHDTSDSILSFNIRDFDFFYLTSESKIWLKHVFGKMHYKYIDEVISGSIYKHECRIKMEVIQDGPPNLTVYSCGSCGSFVDELNLYKHAENSCFKLRKHPCSVCDLPFISSDACLKHEKIHETHNVTANSYRIVSFNKEEHKHINKILLYRSNCYVLYQCRNCNCVVEKSQITEHKCNRRNLKKCSKCILLICITDFELHTLKHQELINFTQKNMKIILFGDSSGRFEEELNDVASCNTIYDYTLYYCSNCLTCTNSRENTLKHKCVNGKSKLRCSNCNLYFNMADLKTHTKLHETDLDYVRGNMRIITFVPPKTEKIVNMYKCKCGVHFLEHGGLVSHYKTCSPKDRMVKEKCSKCDLLFTPSTLFNHMVLHHGDKKQTYKFNIVVVTN